MLKCSNKRPKCIHNQTNGMAQSIQILTFVDLLFHVCWWNCFIFTLMVTIIIEIGKNIKFSIFGTRLAEDVIYYQCHLLSHQMASVILSSITLLALKEKLALLPQVSFGISKYSLHLEFNAQTSGMQHWILKGKIFTFLVYFSASFSCNSLLKLWASFSHQTGYINRSKALD